MARTAHARPLFSAGRNARRADRPKFPVAGRRLQGRIRGGAPPETLLLHGAQLVFRRAVARSGQQFAGSLSRGAQTGDRRSPPACRPLCASARFARFDWKEDETFEAEVWILNDVFARTGPFVVTVTLRAGRAEERILRWESPSVEPNRNTAGPTARFRLPAWDTDRFGVEPERGGTPGDERMLHADVPPFSPQETLYVHERNRMNA